MSLTMSVLESRVAAAQAVTTEACALVREQRIGLDDIDREVLTDRLVAASMHLSAFIAAMLPAGADGPDQIAAVAARHRPRVYPREPRRYAADLIRAGLRSARSARRLTKRIASKPDSRLVKSLTTVVANMEVAHHLASPTPNLAIERVLEGCRESVRRRKGGDGPVTSVYT